MTEPSDDPNAPARRDEHEGEGATRGTARMEAFADGVFAIAFTLPVVHIVMPAIERPGALLSADLAELAPAYAGYLIASAVIGLYWIQHHFSGAIYRTTGHWFLIATLIFLTVIGFIAFPARVLAEHFADPGARSSASLFWVASLAAASWSWLLKWTVGSYRGQVDSRLEPAYVARLNRRYWLLAAANLAALLVALLSWKLGLAVSTVAFLTLLIPPATPRYSTEAPVVEGES